MTKGLQTMSSIEADASTPGVPEPELETYLVVALPDPLRSRMARIRTLLRENGVVIAANAHAAPWLTIAYPAPVPTAVALERLQALDDLLDASRSNIVPEPFNVRLGGWEIVERDGGGYMVCWRVVEGVDELTETERRADVTFEKGASWSRWRPNSCGIYVCRFPESQLGTAREVVGSPEQERVDGVVTVDADRLTLRVKMGSVDVEIPDAQRRTLSPWISMVWPDDRV